MEFKIQKANKIILRPAVTEPKKILSSSSEKIRTEFLQESVKFINIKVCNPCRLVFKDQDSLLLHQSNHDRP
jgi:hypothetical protein